MDIEKCENCGSKHIHVITKEIGYSCAKCGRNTVRLNEMHQTNADRIRSFSDEELAEFLVNFACDNEPTKKETYEWLQSEMEE